MEQYQQYIVQGVAYIFGGGFIAFVTAVLTLRYSVRNAKEGSKQESLETEQKEIETKDIEFKSLKTIIAGLQDEVQSLKKMIRTMCSECSFKSFYEMTEKRLNEKINEKKS
jgi:predicted RNase H-like nuclease (RuvC/YqgF family)